MHLYFRMKKIASKEKRMKSKGLSNTLLWLLGLVAMLSSCNGAEEIVAYDTHNVTFSLSADGEVTIPKIS